MLARRDQTAGSHSKPIDVEVEPWTEHNFGGNSTASSEVERYLRALYRRRWAAISVLVVVVLSTLLYIVFATPEYEGRAKLVINPAEPNVVAFKDVLDENTSKLDYYQTQLEILRSRTLARRTLERLQLWKDPEFNPKPTKLARAIGAFSRLVRPSSREQAVDSEARETARQSQAIEVFQRKLRISYRADTRVFDVGFRSPNAKRAMDVVNTLTQAYIDENLGVKLGVSKQASDWLNDRLAESRRQVESSEEALQRYRESHADVSLSEQQNITVQKLADLSAAATRARMERIGVESEYLQLRSIRDNTAAFDTLPILLANGTIQQLKTELAALQRQQVTLSETLGDRHPDILRTKAAIQRVREQLQAEATTVAESAHNQLTAIQSKERSLFAALEGQKQEALALNAKAIQFNVLQREVTSTRQVFDALLQRTKEMQISSELNVTNIRVVDPAELPQRPIWPQKRVLLALALVVGFPLAVGLVICLEQLDKTIKSTQDIGRLGVRLLGFAPALPSSLGRARLLLDNKRLPQEYAEAIRTVRANLLTAAPSDPSSTMKSVLVTSAGAGEGKTLVAANLAVALAQAGRRVLLVDADMRRSEVHNVFDVGETSVPGLSAVLQARASVRDAVRPSQIAGLSILPAGVSPESAADLLELPVLERVLATIKDEFDWVIIDSPPVAVASDATSLAHTAACVLFVVGSHMTSESEARAALEQLSSAGANIVGAVLSRADRHTSPYRRYRSYYRH